MNMDRLTADEVAERAGTTPEHIAPLAKVGILEPEDDRTYPRWDVLRAGFVLGLDAMAIDANAVADALASGDLRLGYVRSGGRQPRSNRTFAELSDEIDLAFGLPRPTPDEYLREEDVPVIEFIPCSSARDWAKGDVLRLPSVWGDSARRVAEFQSRYLHHSIEEPFRQCGLRDNAAFETASGRSAFGPVGPGRTCSAGSRGATRRYSNR